MSNRRDLVLDAAIGIVGESGIRALTHRAVDAAAGLPAGSTSNLFRTRDALLNAVVEHFAARERANAEELVADVFPATPRELADAIVAFARDATGRNRALTLARYAILLEAAIHPPLRAQLLATGGRVNAWFAIWVRMAGSADPGRDAAIIANHLTGVILHELAIPDPAFDPSPAITALVMTLVRPREAEVPR
ncbi:TetR family transcriptional regulator [Streptosporangiaceae bacterium NEAU-GS5]|nr:TetR family transcriptional regulator [Streptosporangiaceae bacterium NEAU-GS5]